MASLTPLPAVSAATMTRAARARRTPPGRRLPPAVRRQQIIDTARTVFATRGFRGATTRAIAEAAGVTEAVIFQHFADKSALYAAILSLLLKKGLIADWEFVEELRKI